MRIVVTGAGGFVGSHLCQALAPSHDVIAVERSGHPERPRSGVSRLVIGDLAVGLDWKPVFRGVDVIIHLAGRCHVSDRESRSSLAEYRRVNVSATKRLALAAAECGVRRFVFLSSASIHGEATAKDRCISEEDEPAPCDAYALSKLEAERILYQVAEETDMSLVVLRAPLVYGPGVRGRFLSLLRLASARVPLPFGGLCNLRSILGVANLARWIEVCCQHPSAGGGTFLVKDSEDIEVRGLFRTLRSAMGMRPWLPKLPKSCLCGIARVLRVGSQFERLSTSFQIDCSKLQRTLGPCALVSTAEGLTQTSVWYMMSRHQQVDRSHSRIVDCP